MERLAFAFKIKEGCGAKFRIALGSRWDELTSLFTQLDVSNFSIWTAGRLVFAYGESSKNVYADAADALEARFDEVLEPLFNVKEGMRLMYSDIGVVRTDKNLIRHRVFIIHLKDGNEEEYRRRHKGLEDARTETDPGPDSNFTIWYAGGYIFGYDEIDTTMETPPTPEEQQASDDWEKHMFEIMDWVTDDTDALSGARHEHIRRLAWFRPVSPNEK